MTTHAIVLDKKEKRSGMIGKTKGDSGPLDLYAHFRFNASVKPW